MKNLMIGLTIILMIAVTLFWRQVWGIFAGMSVLESMNMIVQFILHVAVATIIGYAAMILPEYIKPWLKAFRWKQRQVRRGSRRPTLITQSPGMSPKKLTVEQILRLLAPATTTIKKLPVQSESDERADLKF